MGKLDDRQGDLPPSHYPVMGWLNEPLRLPLTLEYITMTTATISLAVLGKSESEAIKIIEGAGFRFRIVGRDGRNFIITQDHRPGDRINLVVTDGMVVEANPG